MAGPERSSPHSGTSVSIYTRTFKVSLTSTSDLFDGGMIVLSLYTLNFFHPGPFLFSVPINSVFTPVGKTTEDPMESLPMVVV